MSRSPDVYPVEDSPPERLNTAAEQLRLASTALSALAHLVDEEDDVLRPHIERLESRAAELMRTANRLARDMGVASKWGLDILFAPPAAAPLRPVSPDESIDLEPIELLGPIEPTMARSAQRTHPPWTPRLIVPTPPLGSLESADESTC